MESTTYLPPRCPLSEAINLPNLCGIRHRHHVRPKSHDRAILPVEVNVDVVSTITVHPQEARDVRKLSEKRARDMSQSCISRERLDRDEDDGDEEEKCGVGYVDKRHCVWVQGSLRRALVRGRDGLYRTIKDDRILAHCESFAAALLYQKAESG